MSLHDAAVESVNATDQPMSRASTTTLWEV